jgi:hypothetical protein
MTMCNPMRKLFHRLTSAMDTKTSHMPVDEVVDMAFMRNREATDESRRILHTLNGTLHRMRIAHDKDRRDNA